MRTLVPCVVLAFTIAACKKESPAGTSVVDWNYTPLTPVDVLPTPLTPAKTVTQDVSWPIAQGSAVALRVETEIGEQIVSGTHWHTPRHVRIALAQPTNVVLPKVDCMPAPPGNKVVDNQVVHPVGSDGTTPLGRVSCFFLAPEPDNSVFSIDGDGQVTRSVANAPGS